MPCFFCRPKKEEEQPFIVAKNKKKKSLYIPSLMQPKVLKKIEYIKHFTITSDSSLLIASFFWPFAAHYLKYNIPKLGTLGYYCLPLVLALLIDGVYFGQACCQNRATLKKEINENHLNSTKKIFSELKIIFDKLQQDNPELAQEAEQKIEKYFKHASKTNSVKTMIADITYLTMRAAIGAIFALIFYTKTDEEEKNVYDNVIFGIGLLTSVTMYVLQNAGEFAYEKFKAAQEKSQSSPTPA